MNNFKIGDVVLLKSGGPIMTISAINNIEGIFCIWFNDNKQVKRDTFPVYSLKLHKE